MKKLLTFSVLSIMLYCFYFGSSLAEAKSSSAKKETFQLEALGGEAANKLYLVKDKISHGEKYSGMILMELDETTPTKRLTKFGMYNVNCKKTTAGIYSIKTFDENGQSKEIAVGSEYDANSLGKLKIGLPFTNGVGFVCRDRGEYFKKSRRRQLLSKLFLGGIIGALGGAYGGSSGTSSHCDFIGNQADCYRY